MKRSASRMPSPKETGISAITDKNVVIRHASESDLAEIESRLDHHGLDIDDMDQDTFVVAVEDNKLLGFVAMKIIGESDGAGCVTIAEERRNRGVASQMVRHLIEHSPVPIVLVDQERAELFRELGFRDVKRPPAGLRPLLDFECARSRGRSVFLSSPRSI